MPLTVDEALKRVNTVYSEGQELHGKIDRERRGQMDAWKAALGRKENVPKPDPILERFEKWLNYSHHLGYTFGTMRMLLLELKAPWAAENLPSIYSSIVSTGEDTKNNLLPNITALLQEMTERTEIAKPDERATVEEIKRNLALAATNAQQLAEATQGLQEALGIGSGPSARVRTKSKK
jgi:hypothetical protein